MTELNLVNLQQDVGLPGSSEKLQKGKAGKEPEQMMPFACVMGNACRTTTQKTEKAPLNVRPDKGKIGGRSDKGNATRRCNTFNIDSDNNIMGAGKDKTEKTNRSLLVKGKGIAESSHGAILKGEATMDINPFMNASKGKRTKINRSFSGKIDLLSKRDVQKQTRGKVKNLQVSSGPKKSEAGINHALTGDARGSLKSGLNKQSIESGLPKSGIIGVVAGKDAAFKKSMGARVADPVGENFRTVKGAVAVSKGVDFKESGGGINNALVSGQRTKNKEQRAKMENAPGLLKSGLKNAAVVEGKSVAEPDKTEKKSFTLVKSGHRNDIGNSLKHLGLNVEEAAAEHKKTGVKEFPDHKTEILHKGIPIPERSSGSGFSANGYHNATFHASGRSSSVNESVNSRAIEPRALINQIASSVKRPGRVRLTLNPPRLGTLNVDVLVRDNKVHVMLQPENNDVRQILQSNMESLKSSLRNHGLIVDTINVSVQEKSDGANYGADYRSGQNETLFREGGKREGNQEDQGGGQDFVNHDPTLLEEENPRFRSGERISLFA
ncbi:MAG TPA: flagellar hook-length control protein FliK [Anaerolineae bacterium]|nr:flagellar hook-length control protein FliK [Anaerolineae bacterium]